MKLVAGGEAAPRAGRDRRGAARTRSALDEVLADARRRAARRRRAPHPLLERARASRSASHRGASPPIAAWRRLQLEPHPARRALHRRRARPSRERSSCAIVGRKGREYFARRKRRSRSREDYAGVDRRDRARRARARSPTDAHRTTSVDGKVDAVYVVYNEFKSADHADACSVEPAPADRRRRKLPAASGARIDFELRAVEARSCSTRCSRCTSRSQLYRALLESIAVVASARR